MTTTLRWAKEPLVPQSINEHVQHAIAKVPDLSPRQRNAVVAAMVTLCRDIAFLKQVHDAVGWAPRDHSEGTLPPVY
jgi:hypothetical protein